MKTVKCVLVLVSFIAISISLSSCESTVTNNSSNSSGDFQFSVWDYSDNYFLLDTIYKRSFSEVYKDSITSYVTENTLTMSNNDLEVWVQCDITESRKRFCVGWMMLTERPVQGYDTSYINTESAVDKKFAGYFKILDTAEFYINRQAGFVGLKATIPENYHVGIAYKTLSNKIYGQGRNISGSTDTLILKLIKVDSPDPATTPLAWKLKMKNIYRLPYYNLLSSTVINLMYLHNNEYINRLPVSYVLLITMLKLDRFNNGTLLPPPDGKFDWIENKTIYPETGDIIFPILEPFGQGLQDAGVSSEYQFNEIYTQTKSQTQGNAKANMYKLMGTAVYNVAK
jgi:hypothetical protein